MDAPVRLANHFTHGGHDAGCHGRTVASAAPGIGWPILVFVVDRVRGLRSEETDQAFHDDLLSLLHGTPRPRHRIVSFHESRQQSRAPFCRSEISGNKLAGRLVTLQDAIQPTFTPEWFLIGHPVLDHRAHRHMLRQNVTLRRQHRLVSNPHSKRQRHRHDGIFAPPVARI